MEQLHEKCLASHQLVTCRLGGAGGCLRMPGLQQVMVSFLPVQGLGYAGSSLGTYFFAR